MILHSWQEVHLKGDAQAADGELRFGSLRTLVGLGSCRCQKCTKQVRVPGGLFSRGSLFRCGGFKILQIGLRTHLVRRFGMVLTCFRLFLNMVLENARPESSLKVPNPLLLTYKHLTGRFEGSQARSGKEQGKFRFKVGVCAAQQQA